MFKSDESIWNIELVLEEKKAWRNIYYVWWNNIWWEWHIKYEIEYSTWVIFDNPEIFETGMYNKMFFEKDLWKDFDIYFFRVRAFYNDEYSSWSNKLSIINKRNILNLFNIECIECNNTIWYWDVFDDFEFLIDKEFQIKCVNCKKKVWFYDIWKSEDFLLDELKTSCSRCSNYSNNKLIDFSDLVK